METLDANLIPAKFSIDDSKEFNGYRLDPPVFWNGWECPYFEMGVVQDIAKEFKNSIRIENDRVFDITYATESGDVKDEFEYEPITYGDKILYPVGAWSWCWDSNL